MPPPRLRVRHTAIGVTDTLGPGRRSVVWVQGCTLHCPGCIVPEMWGPASAGDLVDPLELANRLLAADPEAALTVSGGEPTEQAAAVAVLLSAAKALGRTTWVYTGRTLEELLAGQDATVLKMLAYVDVLVDGRFEQSRAAALPYRGSANQRILRLTEAIPSNDAEPGLGGRIDVTIDSTGTLVVIGIPPPGFLARFQAGLGERGVSVSPQHPWH